MILRARIVAPISQPPIENGAVLISGDRLLAVDGWPAMAAHAGTEVVDLGEVVLMPGWINSHCHLDYTDMAGQIAPLKSFADWLKAITSLKSTWPMTDYRNSWLHGAQMLLQTGTTTVANMEAMPGMLPIVVPQTPLRLFSFLELIGIKNEPPPPNLLTQMIDPLMAAPVQPQWLGLSPHAPYSTTPELLEYSAQYARQKRWRLTTHVAESEQEFNMFMYGQGPMFDWLKTQRNVADCGHGSPIQHLASLGILGRDFLAVHVNYLWHEDTQLLKENGVSVVHCPRSHAYFAHQGFRHNVLQAAGVNLCLGTDSLVSVKLQRGQPLELNMFAELQTFAAATSIVSPESIVRMATINGALALGLSGQVGELSPGAWADLIAVPFKGNVADVYEGIIHHSGPVTASMIGGQWAIVPRQGIIDF